MKSELSLTPQIQIVYAEEIPSEEIGVKESYKLGEGTLARFESMKMKALMQGYFVTGKSHADKSQKLFAEPGPKKEGLPSLKLSEAIAAGNGARDRAKLNWRG